MMKLLLSIWLLLSFFRILALEPVPQLTLLPFTGNEMVFSHETPEVSDPEAPPSHYSSIAVLTAITDSATLLNAEPAVSGHPDLYTSAEAYRRPDLEHSHSSVLLNKAEADSRYLRDTLDFRGQISAWAGLSATGDLPVRLGGRIIPQFNYGVFLRSQKQVDFEVSVNTWGVVHLSPFDSLQSEGGIKAWRAWARFSGKQYELRAGLQKINFGSASMLRPLMWFDQMDARDPLQLTDGVWGILGRYYFLNNANVWLWTLYGNKGRRAWDTMESTGNSPEFGGRIQVPVLPGEAAFSYHYRNARLPHYLQVVAATPPLLALQAKDDSGALLLPGNAVSHPEHRFALDGKWDIGPGVWFESVWIHNSGNYGILTNQTMHNLGADYTFGIGNGLNLTLEHLIFSYHENAFAFGNATSFSALSATYPLGINHHLSTIIYYDWDKQNLYSFLNWRVQLPGLILYSMFFRNPRHLQLPGASSGNQLFSGTGVQVMLVYNL